MEPEVVLAANSVPHLGSVLAVVHGNEHEHLEVVFVNADLFRRRIFIAKMLELRNLVEQFEVCRPKGVRERIELEEILLVPSGLGAVGISAGNILPPEALTFGNLRL